MKLVIIYERKKKCVSEDFLFLFEKTSLNGDTQEKNLSIMDVVD